MSQEINFSDLNEVQKEQYIKYIIENNIPLQEDSQKREVVAEIKLQTSQKKIIQKYESLKQQQQMGNEREQSPIAKYKEDRDGNMNIKDIRTHSRSPNMHQSTPSHPKMRKAAISDNKENEDKGKQLTKSSPKQSIRTSATFSTQPKHNSINNNNFSSGGNSSIRQRIQFEGETDLKNKNDKSPLRKKSINTITSSVLKEIDYFGSNQMTESDNKRTLTSKNMNANRSSLILSNSKGKQQQQIDYLPSTLRKLSIREIGGQEQENKRRQSISPNQNNKRGSSSSSSQIQIFSAKGAFTGENKNSKVSNTLPIKRRDNSSNNRRYPQENTQDPFNLTMSTIDGKDNNSKFTNFTTECSLFNRTSKSGNILIVDNNNSSENHSQSTSSSNSNSNQIQQSNQVQSNLSTISSLPNSQSISSKQNKMNEIYDILKSVGFCPNNTNGSEWQSVTGGEMRSDPQELSIKFDTRYLLADSIFADENISDTTNKPDSQSPNNNKQQQQQQYDSNYLQILKQKKQSQGSQNGTAQVQIRGRSANTCQNKNNSGASPIRKKPIPQTAGTALRIQNQDVSPQEKRDKSSGQIQDAIFNSVAQKELKLNSQITQLFKFTFTRLTKIPTTHLNNLIEEIYASKEISTQKQIKQANKKNNSLNQNHFKEFVYDFFLKKYKNNQKIGEQNLFNFIGSVEYHDQHSNSLIAHQFLEILNDKFTEDQMNFFLYAHHQIQQSFKQSCLQYVHLSEKSVFKISLKLFNQPEQSTVCYEIIELVSKEECFIKSQTIAAYNYLEIVMQIYKSAAFNSTKCREQESNTIENKQITADNHYPPSIQKPFSMINESFGVQNDVYNNLFTTNYGRVTQQINYESTENTKQKNNLKSILNNKEYTSERINSNVVKATDFFFSNQQDELQQEYNKQHQQQQQKQQLQYSLNKQKVFYTDQKPLQTSQIGGNGVVQQDLQKALFNEMERIVSEFVQMFEIQSRQSCQKLEETILKKCKYLIMCLIQKENSKWFDLLQIDYPNYQQKMQAETIMKLYQAYERSFIQNSLSSNESKNLRSLCKLILKVPELNDAISKLLICVLVPDS